ncbi:glycosyltransferase [Pseudomonas capeferrum]|uniref:glycosyltransferase n=1 Tax=Pseudomonas capeferrum TaxID=1495066 RepID=UPI0015E296A0|nr:glycosyltransferase [Pseudomonas capeferrum]MBA1200825.1 glycosyltransferase [Pseudomonas capeferrum]
MSKPPLVSIVIPAFNPRFFAMALQSAMAQTYECLEVVVCDDSDGGEIERVVRSFEGAGVSVRYIRNDRHLGFVGNVRQAVALASGEFVKILCDDDRLFPACVERQAQALADHSDVSLVLAQRVLADPENFILPMRMSNAQFANVDTLFKGDDILAVLEGRSLSFLGNLSAALMRREQAHALLQALTQGEHGFVGLLDQALFVCLMRGSNLVMISDPCVVERIHPQRLSKQESVVRVLPQERQWLQQMLAARGGEAAPASGWVRHLPLAAAEQQPRQWRELHMVLLLSNWQTCMQGRVGGESESYAEFYREWFDARKFSDAQRRQLPHTLQEWPRHPRIVTLVLDPEGDATGVELTLDSLEAQLYGAYECVVMSTSDPLPRAGVRQVPLQADWPLQVNRELEVQVQADWFYLLRAGDVLGESALLILAERIAVIPGLACIYSDEGALVDGQSQEPVFKPAFNIDLLRSYPYVGRALAFELDAVRSLGGFDSTFAELAPHDLIWRLVETRGPQVIEHIPEIQFQSRFSYAQWLSLPSVIEQNMPLVQAHLARLGVAHRIHHDGNPLLHRVEYLHDSQPLVSVVVACGSDLAGLQATIQSVIEQTGYPRFEVVIVAGAETDPAMEQWLEAMSEVGQALLRIVRTPGGNDAALLRNAAAEQANGEYLLMLSAGLQALDPGWLEELLQLAQRPEVGVVGCKILDRQDRVAQAGIVLGVGSAAGPAFVGEDAQAGGYLQRLQVVQNWTAVSADCLMVRKEVLESLGGFDVHTYASGLAEIDFCLRAKADGYLIAWTPHARLRATTRDVTPAAAGEAERTFCERWWPTVINDPAYNPNLNLGSANFSLEATLQGSWNPLCARVLPSVLCLPINASAVGHYRVTQPFRELEAAGRVVGRIAYESLNSIQLARMDPDVIILQLRHTAESAKDIERIARYSKARRVFEIDDYVLKTPSLNNHARNTPADIEQQLQACMGLCDRVVVTTQALADAFSHMHSDIRVVPNMLAPELWLGLQSRRQVSRKPRIGWGGGTSHGGDLEVIAEVVRELAGHVEWVFFGMCPEHLKPYIHEFHPVVGLQAYPRKLASLNLDLALAPLEFHVFNDCKSNLRLLEYGACGYPVICSDTAAYRGDLPCTRVRSNSAKEWLEAIRMHLKDPVASYRMGDELRERVLRDYVLRGDSLRQWEWAWLAD